MAELAGRRGVEIGPETGFCEASGLGPTLAGGTWHETVPSDGSLPATQLEALGEALAPFTSAPDRCFFCVWEGFAFWGGRVGYSIDPLATAEEREAARLEAVARADREHAQIDGLPRVRLPHRDHDLFTGPLAATGGSFRFGVWQQSPNLWWPADRAWFVSTEIDGYSTYVGGTTACVESILAHPGLEARQVTADVGVAPGPYA